MKRLTAIAIALLAGCAAPGYWHHPTADIAQRERDQRERTYQAAAATSNTPSTFSLSQNVAQDIATGVRRGELEQLCVRAKGYTWVSQ